MPVSAISVQAPGIVLTIVYWLHCAAAQVTPAPWYVPLWTVQMLENYLCPTW